MRRKGLSVEEDKRFHAEEGRRSRALHPDSYKASKEKYRATPEGKEKERAYRKEYYRAHKDKENERSRQAKINNREYFQLKEQERNARIRHARGKMPVTAKAWEMLKDDYGGRCAYCNKIASLEMDHIVPITRGGKHEIENIVPACKSCNSRKYNIPLLVWMYRTSRDAVTAGNL